MLVLGVIGVGTHNAVSYLVSTHDGDERADPEFFIPVMVITISWIFLRERLTRCSFRRRRVARRRS
jgi:hypothetical protein